MSPVRTRSPAFEDPGIRRGRSPACERARGARPRVGCAASRASRLRRRTQSPASLHERRPLRGRLSSRSAGVRAAAPPASSRCACRTGSRLRRRTRSPAFRKFGRTSEMHGTARVRLRLNHSVFHRGFNGESEVPPRCRGAEPRKVCRNVDSRTLTTNRTPARACSSSRGHGRSPPCQAWSLGSWGRLIALAHLQCVHPTATSSPAASRGRIARWAWLILRQHTMMSTPCSRGCSPSVRRWNRRSSSVKKMSWRMLPSCVMCRAKPGTTTRTVRGKGRRCRHVG